MRDLLPPAQVMPAAQPMGGAPVQPSPLAQALMSRTGGFPQMQSPSIPVPLMSMLMQKSSGSGAGQGLGNWMQGYDWNGMAGGKMLDALSQQASQNVATQGPM